MEAIASALKELFTVANTLTPLAIIGLLIGVIYLQVYKQPTKEQVSTIADNHLHGLPQIEENTRLMVDSLRRIENQQTAGFATIIAKLEK